MGNKSRCHENVPPVKIMTIRSAPSEKIQSTSPLVILETVNTYLGRYVFFSREALELMDWIADLVDRFIKLKMTWPLMR